MFHYLSFSKARLSGHPLDAGSYVVGDPCYFVPPSKWVELLESCDYFSGGVGTFDWEGHPIKVVAFRTQYGDGCYTGSDGNSYGVDSGMIGLMSKADFELCSGKGSSSSLFNVFEHTFLAPFNAFVYEGVFYYGDLRIDTAQGENASLCVDDLETIY